MRILERWRESDDTFHPAETITAVSRLLHTAQLFCSVPAADVPCCFIFFRDFCLR